MSEQISRRAQNITDSKFEGAFETTQVRYGSNTLNLKDSLDIMEGWARLTNIWHQNEGEATTRPGETSLATHGVGTTCHSIRKLRDPQTPANTTRYWGVGSTLHRGLTGATSSIDAGYSGDPLTLLPHRPSLSGDPWMFVADRDKMRKVNVAGLVLPIGLPAPGSAVTSKLDAEYSCPICMCDSADGTAFGSWTGAPGLDENGHPSGTPAAMVSSGPALPGGSGDGVYGVTTLGGTVDSGYDCWWGVAHAKDLTVLTEVGGSATVDASDQDIMHVWLKCSDPQDLAEIRLYVVVSSTFEEENLPGTNIGGTAANTDAYVKAFRPNDYIKFVQATRTQIEAAEEARIFALRDTDSRTRAYSDTRPGWQDKRATADPGRARGFQIGIGQHQWFGYGQLGSPLRRGDFQRIGSTPGRDWSTVTGIILYIRTNTNHTLGIGMDDFYITGGFSPDTCEPGVQSYDYKVTNYDPRTGAESNGSPEQLDIRSSATTFEDANIDPLRRRIIIDPPSHGDSAVRQRFYRRGGTLFDDWFYLGQNSADGATFTDDFSDTEIATAGSIPTDHFQPVPTLTEDGTTVLAQEIPAIWGPIEGMLMGCGDPYRPGYVYFSNPDAPDHWSSAGYVEVSPPSEELMHGGLLGHQAFVFSRTRLYFLYPGLSGSTATFTAVPGLCTRGLFARWAFCAGPMGVVFFVAEDGIFATSGGPEQWLSETINPLFYGTEVNGYKAIDKTATSALRLTVWENDLYFQYQDTAGARQVMVYSILQKFWRHYLFGKAPAVLQGEDEEILLIGGRATGASYTHSGTSDDGSTIACTIRTGSFSAGRREEKLFGDIFLDCDPDATELSLQVFLNEESHANLAIPISSGTTGRQRFLVDAFGVNPQKAHSIASQLSWTSSTSPTLYQIGYAITLQPDLTNTRVSNWDDLNSPDETWLTGITLDCDTAGQTKTINIERDFAGTRSIVATFDVTSSNRHKFKFSWLAVPAHMVRIRPDPLDCVPWLLYRADWIYVQEPPRISKWDIHFENQWDQYYTGLDLYCDTFGAEKRIEVWVDETRLVNSLAGGLTYWPIIANGRRVVHLTLPWGRGHVFRFFATDDNEGLLYTHRWHTQDEPSEQANWNQNFSILGTHADKWLKAIIFECDTFGQDKSVQVEVDGTVVQTLTVNADGRRVLQLALSDQHLGRVWRMFPVDANPGRLYTAEPIFDEEPFCFDRWETQETNHGLPGWFYPVYGHITVKSSADVTLTTVMQHNQVGGTTTHTYTISSTGGQKQRRFLNGFFAGKGVLIKYILTSSVPFWLYREETTLVIQPWGAANAITVSPFGSDDQDPARPMTHSILAAQASGGAASAAGAGQ